MSFLARIVPNMTLAPLLAMLACLGGAIAQGGAVAPTAMSQVDAVDECYQLIRTSDCELV